MAHYYRAREKTITLRGVATLVPDIPAGYEHRAQRWPGGGGGTQPWGVKTPVPLPPPSPTNRYTEITLDQAAAFGESNGLYTRQDLIDWGGWGE